MQHLQKRDFPDEQIWKRFAAFVQDTRNRAWADESLGLVLTDDEAASYLEQALSLFGAIAIVYGQQVPDDWMNWQPIVVGRREGFSQRNATS